MSSPLIQFWKETYAEFAAPIEEGLGFHNPQFLDPLMSPNFVMGPLDKFLAGNPKLAHFNLIQKGAPSEELMNQYGFQLQKKFTVGILDLRHESPSPQEFSTSWLPLKEAISRDFFWLLIQDGFEKDLPLLKKLLPFLAESPARFETLILEHNGVPAAAITLGMQKEVALVLNAVVKKNARRLGLSHHLVTGAKNRLLSEKVLGAFFWTELPFLGDHANSTEQYLIYSRP